MTYLLETLKRIEEAKQNDFEGIAVLYGVLDIHAALVRRHVTDYATKQLLAA